MNLDAEKKVKRETEVDLPPRKKANKRSAETPGSEIIPEKFKKHVKSLGFQESDITVLYKNKDDWMGISTGWLQVNFTVVYKSLTFIIQKEN